MIHKCNNVSFVSRTKNSRKKRIATKKKYHALIEIKREFDRWVAEKEHKIRHRNRKCEGYSSYKAQLKNERSLFHLYDLLTENPSRVTNENFFS